MPHLRIKNFLISVEFLSKFFLLSPHGTCARPRWKDLRLSNAFVLTGFICYFCYHFNYVTNNDNVSERIKLVTYFIDNYNKYSGLMLVTILVLVQFYFQENTAKINRIFEEIDEIFEKELKVEVGNVKAVRLVYLQVLAMFSGIIYTEYNNCLMYLTPTSIGLQDNCLIICIIPMLVVATVECRLFAYFLLIRDRLKILNDLIDFYRKQLKRNESIDSDFMITDEIFFIKEFKPVMKKKFLEPKKKSSNFLKILLDFRNHKDIYQPVSSINFVERIMSIKSIYSKLYEISDKINAAYGIQIIAIIAVQFITLTTLLYYFTMKLVRLLSAAQMSESDKNGILSDLWSSVLWISIYMYKVYSLCFSVHLTIDEGRNVGNYLHVFGLYTKSLREKFKIKHFMLQILQQRIKFAPYGLFEINLGLFSMIVGAIVTYILILIQFDVAQKT